MLAGDEPRLTGAVARGREVEFSFDGHTCVAFEGETVAAALLAIGQRTLGLTERRGKPRGMYCGIGLCFDCVMRIDGHPNVRACQTPVRAGMRVESQVREGTGKDEGIG